MTRFQIVGIFKSFMCTSTEFNGDGYFDGYGHEVCEMFQDGTAYRDIVNTINQEFEYEEDGDKAYNMDLSSLDFYKLENEKQYFEVWFSDYLYIKNFSPKDVNVKDSNGRNIVLHPGGWITINFGELDIRESADYDVKRNNNVDIGLPERLDIYSDELNKWNITTDIKNNKAGKFELFTALTKTFNHVVADFDMKIVDGCMKTAYIIKITNIRWATTEQTKDNNDMKLRKDYYKGCYWDMDEKLWTLGETITLRELLDCWWNSVRINEHICYKNAYEADPEYELDGLEESDLDRLVEVAEEYTEDADGYPIVYATFAQ